MLAVRRDREAARHLFRVAAGLDSLVLGESQILGQVRAAYAAALESGATGPLLNRLFHQAFEVGKRVRTETSIGERPASVAAAAVELARSTLGGLEGKRVLVLGAGKTGALAAGALASHGSGAIVVASRSRQHAARVAQRLGGEAVDLAAVEAEVGNADVVLSATASPTPILTAAQVARSAPARAGRPLLLIDLAVPRDLDPAIRAVGGCTLCDLDDLQSLVADGLAGRRHESRKAEAIVAAALARFDSRQRALEAAPLIESLSRRAHAIRTAALAKAEPKLAGLSPRERAAVETLTAQIVGRLVHPTIAHLRDAAEDGAVLPPDAVRCLLGLTEPAGATGERRLRGAA